MRAAATVLALLALPAAGATEDAPPACSDEEYVMHNIIPPIAAGLSCALLLFTVAFARSFARQLVSQLFVHGPRITKDIVSISVFGLYTKRFETLAVVRMHLKRTAELPPQYTPKDCLRVADGQVPEESADPAPPSSPSSPSQLQFPGSPKSMANLGSIDEAASASNVDLTNSIDLPAVAVAAIKERVLAPTFTPFVVALARNSRALRRAAAGRTMGGRTLEQVVEKFALNIQGQVARPGTRLTIWVKHVVAKGVQLARKTWSPASVTYYLALYQLIAMVLGTGIGAALGPKECSSADCEPVCGTPHGYWAALGLQLIAIRLAVRSIKRRVPLSMRKYGRQRFPWVAESLEKLPGATHWFVESNFPLDVALSQIRLPI